MKKNKKYAFEEEYFEGEYFTKKVGHFTKQRDRELSNWFKASIDFVNRYVPIKKSEGKTLIEFGCAYGSAAKVLRELGLKVLATDISNLAIERAIKLHPDIEFKTQDIQKPVKGKFDYVFATDVLEHLENPEKAIKNMFNTLRSGGIAIISTQNDFPYKKQDPTHISVKNPMEWKKIFKKMGFSSVRVVPATYFPPYLYRFHWRFNIVLPIAVFSTIFLSTVFIFAKK